MAKKKKGKKGKKKAAKTAKKVVKKLKRKAKAVSKKGVTRKSVKKGKKKAGAKPKKLEKGRLKAIKKAYLKAMKKSVPAAAVPVPKKVEVEPKSTDAEVVPPKEEEFQVYDDSAGETPVKGGSSEETEEYKESDEFDFGFDRPDKVEDIDEEDE